MSKRLVFDPRTGELIDEVVISPGAKPSSHPPPGRALARPSPPSASTNRSSSRTPARPSRRSRRRLQLLVLLLLLAAAGYQHRDRLAPLANALGAKATALLTAFRAKP
ncbi:MAG: hypothetical protein FJ387_07000 [Verrucomicrobia bacterium]|nr:hypothetical protein [Verrucomicrobiota bacterium]